MNPKFFDVRKEKQDAIINASLMVFAENGYRKASTDVIVKEAGISKGLLFHYFNSKLGVYEFMYNYSVKYMLLELTQSVRRNETDFFNIQRMIELCKTKVMKNYPYMQQFLSSVKYETHPDALRVIAPTENLIEDTYNKIYKKVDMSKFPKNVDLKKVITMIGWMSDGYIKDKFRDGTPDLDEMNAEFALYLSMLREQFYALSTKSKAEALKEKLFNQDNTVEKTAAARDDSVMDSMKEASIEKVAAELKKKEEPPKKELSFEERLRLGRESAYSSRREPSIEEVINKSTAMVEKELSEEKAVPEKAPVPEEETPVVAAKKDTETIEEDPGVNEEAVVNEEAAINEEADDVSEEKADEIVKEEEPVAETEESSENVEEPDDGKDIEEETEEAEAEESETAEKAEEAEAKEETEEESEEETAKEEAAGEDAADEDTAEEDAADEDAADEDAAEEETVEETAKEQEVKSKEENAINEVKKKEPEASIDQAGEVTISVDDFANGNRLYDINGKGMSEHTYAASATVASYIPSAEISEYYETSRLSDFTYGSDARGGRGIPYDSSENIQIFVEEEDDDEDELSQDVETEPDVEPESTEASDSVSEDTKQNDTADEDDFDLDSLMEKIITNTSKETAESERTEELLNMGPAPVLPEFSPEKLRRIDNAPDDDDENSHVYRPPSF